VTKLKKALRNLEVSVNQPVGLKIVIILSKRVDQLLCNLQDEQQKIKQSKCSVHVSKQAL